MIVLTLFSAFYSLLTLVSNVVFPVLPEAVTNIIAYILQLIYDGIDLLGLFIDFDVIGPLCSFTITMWLALMTVDLMWKLIGYIKLSRKN